MYWFINVPWDWSKRKNVVLPIESIGKTTFSFILIRINLFNYRELCTLIKGTEPTFIS